MKPSLHARHPLLPWEFAHNFLPGRLRWRLHESRFRTRTSEKGGDDVADPIADNERLCRFECLNFESNCIASILLTFITSKQREKNSIFELWKVDVAKGRNGVVLLEADVSDSSDVFTPDIVRWVNDPRTSSFTV